MRKALLRVGLVGITAFALGACGGGSSSDKLAKAVKDATNGSVDVNTKDGNIKISGSDGNGNGGSVDIGSGELPDELKDFPLPDGAKVTSSFSSSGDNGSGTWVSAVANGDYKEVSAGIQSALEGDDATISGNYEAESNGVGTSTFSYEQGDKSGTVMVSEDDSTDGFNLMITVTIGPNLNSTTTSG